MFVINSNFWKHPLGFFKPGPAFVITMVGYNITDV